MNASIRQCPVCRAGYRTWGRLQNHIKATHPIRLDDNAKASLKRKHSDIESALPLNSPDIQRSLWDTPDEPPEAQQIRAEIEGLIEPTADDQFVPFSGPAGLPLDIVHAESTTYMHIQCQQYGGITPFKSNEAYVLAKWFTEERSTVKGVNKLLKGMSTVNPANNTDIPVFPVHPAVLKSFTSTHTMRNLIDEMPETQNWTLVKTSFRWNFDDQEPISYWKSRSLRTVIEWFLCQRRFRDDIVYAPVQKKVGGMPLFDEMNTCQWWWEEQVRCQISLSYP